MGRAAIPSISGYKYFLEDNGTELEELPITDGSYSYKLVLNQSYKLKVVMKSASGTTAILSSEEWDITPSRTNLSSLQHDFLLSQKGSETGTGSINLEMNIDSTAADKIKSITAKSGSKAFNVTGSGTSYKIEEIKNSDGTGGVQSGVNEVEINFYSGLNASGFLVYSTTQSITVLPDLETNIWKSSGTSSLITNPTAANPKGEFKITGDLLTEFGRTQIYVGNTSVGNTNVVDGIDCGTGSPYSPFSSLSKAVTMIENYGSNSNDYTIWISSEGMNGTATLGSSIKARSITFCGLNGLKEDGTPKDSLRGAGYNKPILSITASTTVKIRNLNITASSGADYGGGIYAEGSNVKVILESGAYITNNKAKQLGGGIYLKDSAELVINAGAKITGNNVTVEDTNGGHGGMALYVQSSTVTMNGGEISGSKGTKTNHRGPIRLAGSAVFNLKGGKISGNSAIHMGGCFYLANSSKLNISGGEITDCQIGSDSTSYDACGGAILALDDCIVTMTGGKIHANKALASLSSSKTGSGGAVDLLGKSKFCMSGGTIENNEIKKGGNKQGGAVRVLGEATFEMSGSAYIPYGVNGVEGAGKNDVFLGSGRFITVAGEPTGTKPVATITLQSFEAGRQVLVLAIDSPFRCRQHSHQLSA